MFWADQTRDSVTIQSIMCRTVFKFITWSGREGASAARRDDGACEITTLCHASIAKAATAAFRSRRFYLRRSRSPSLPASGTAIVVVSLVVSSASIIISRRHRFLSLPHSGAQGTTRGLKVKCGRSVALVASPPRIHRARRGGRGRPRQAAGSGRRRKWKRRG